MPCQEGQLIGLNCAARNVAKPQNFSMFRDIGYARLLALVSNLQILPNPQFAASESARKYVIIPHTDS